MKEKKEFEEDVINIINMQGTPKGEELGINNMNFAYNIGYVIHDVKTWCGGKDREYTFYSVEIDIDNYYIICGYINASSERGRRFFDDTEYLSKLLWIRYDSIQDVKPNVDDLIITRVFFVYDILIKEDIINNIKYNKKYKYYSEMMYDREYQRASKKLNKEMILWHHKDIDEIEKPELTNYEFGHNAYEAYTDDNGEMNFVFICKETYSDGIKQDLLKFEWEGYNDLIKISKESNHLNEMREILSRDMLIDGKKEQVYLEKVMISVSDIKKYIEEKRNEKNN